MSSRSRDYKPGAAAKRTALRVINRRMIIPRLKRMCFARVDREHARVPISRLKRFASSSTGVFIFDRGIVFTRLADSNPIDGVARSGRASERASGNEARKDFA